MLVALTPPLLQNFGCTHFIIGRDMAGSKSSIDGEDFYGAYDAQVCARVGVRSQPDVLSCECVYARTVCVSWNTSSSHSQCVVWRGSPWCACSQNFAKDHAEELGIKTVESLNLVCTETGEYVTAESAKVTGEKVMKLSGTEFRRRLRAGEEIPEWFAFKSVVDVLRAAQ